MQRKSVIPREVPVGAPAVEEGRAVVREVAAALEAAYRLSVPPDPLARDRNPTHPSHRKNPLSAC